MSVLVVIVLGTAVAVVLFKFDPLSRLGLDLAKSLAPLSLPFLVLLLVAAARGLPLVLAVGAFVLGVLFAWKVVVLPEWDDVKKGFMVLGARLKSDVTRPPGIVATEPAPSGWDLAFTAARTLVPPAVFIALALSPSFRAGGRGGFATALAEGALMVLGVALLARLFSFAKTPLRAFLAFTVFALALRAFIQAGFLPWDAELRDKTPWLTLRNLCFVVAASFVVCAVVEILQERAKDKKAPQNLVLRLSGKELLPGWAWRGARTGGLVACLLATVFLILSVGVGMYVISQARGNDPGHSRPAVPLAALPGGSELRPSQLSPKELAKTYMPVFVYASGQRWLPSPVRGYLRDATLTARDGTVVPAPPSGALPPTCGADVAPPCYQLTINCPTAGLDCAGADPVAESERLHRQGTVYARVLRRGLRPSGALLDHPPTPREGGVFDYPGPFGDPIETLVQYWLFYRYDEWTAPTMLGRLVQQHEADWEAITIGFSADEPLFVGYSAHCGGRWLPWRDIQVAADLEPRTHPVVAVAEGSHANYESQNRRPPDWASCLGINGAALAALTYVWGIEDVTGDHYRLLPTNVILVDRRTSPMSFPGNWGLNDHTAIRNRRGFTLGTPGSGPRSPPLQALWSDPITTTFCSREWSPRKCKGVREPAVRRLIAALDDDAS